MGQKGGKEEGKKKRERDKLMSLFIYFFFCRTWAFFSCGEQGRLFAAVFRLLIATASLVAVHRLEVSRPP